ncbi:MAG TPA: TonB-dependent receptor [Terriglobales bacterium]|nr:TonB-dependent receptor [Terriglobales bacterium]
MIVRTIAALLLAAGCLAAQNTPAEKREPDSQELNEDSIEIRDVRESSAKDVGEALQSVTGISKIRKAGIANDVVLRGFQQDNINVQVDGARIYGACPNNMDPSASHVDFAEVDRVEVVKGPYDVRSQGSLGGTVRIITRDEEVRGLRVVPSFSYGSFGYYNPSIEMSTDKKLVGFSAGYAFRTSDPYKDGSGRRFTSYGNFRPEVSNTRAFEGHSGWGSLVFTPGTKQRLDIGYSRQQNGLGLYPYLMMDAIYDNADRATIKYAARNLSGFVRSVRIDGFGTKVNHLMNDARRTSSGILPYSMQTHAVTSSFGINAAADIPGDVTMGVESYRRTWNAITQMRSGSSERMQNSLPDATTTSVGTYAEVDRQLTARVRLQSGARFDHVESGISPSTLLPNLYYAYNNTTSTSSSDNFAGGNVRLTVSLLKGLDLLTGIGSTMRVPDPQERYFLLQRMNQDWVGNPDLKPVRNSEADMGLSIRRRDTRLRVLFYFSKLDDYIALHRQRRVNNVPGVMNSVSQSYANLNAQMYGGEINLSQPIGKFVALSGGASLTRGSKDTNPVIDVFNSNIVELPPTKSWLNIRYANDWLYAQVGGTVAGAQRRVDRDLNEQPTPGYGIMNLKVGVRRSRFNVNFAVDNLLSRFYYESFSYSRDPFRSGLKVAEPGRALFMSGSYRF